MTEIFSPTPEEMAGQNIEENSTTLSKRMIELGGRVVEKAGTYIEEFSRDENGGLFGLSRQDKEKIDMLIARMERYKRDCQQNMEEDLANARRYETEGNTIVQEICEKKAQVWASTIRDIDKDIERYRRDHKYALEIVRQKAESDFFRYKRYDSSS